MANIIDINLERRDRKIENLGRSLRKTYPVNSGTSLPEDTRRLAEKLNRMFANRARRAR